MFKKILIANRGEIAVRIIRTCQELGIKTVGVYAPGDELSLHVKMTDETCPLQQVRSYLNIEEIVEAARRTGAEAIHPGYGFLSERADFARACQAHGIVFIGPDCRTMEAVGDKVNARQIVGSAGVPIVPGYSNSVHCLDDMIQQAEKIGYPVLIKAAGGGGGRGMRLAYGQEELIERIQSARREAASCFGNDNFFLEKYLTAPRHVEVQILADAYGQMVHLGERDCSVQRRHQKLVEESPSPAVHPRLREELGLAALRVAGSVGYVGAGTVEFLLNPDGTFYFIEVNARIQVEHPVTELVTGMDIVKEQIRIAAGEPLGYTQSDISFRGWAIECRLNAEDAFLNFLPTPGVISDCNYPGGPGVRMDTAIFPGSPVSPFYDSMFGKLITWGNNRGEAIQRMRRALAEIKVEGIQTTIPFHQWIMQHPSFCRGDVTTRFVEQHWEPLLKKSVPA